MKTHRRSFVRPVAASAAFALATLGLTVPASAEPTDDPTSQEETQVDETTTDTTEETTPVTDEETATEEDAVADDTATDTTDETEADDTVADDEPVADDEAVVEEDTAAEEETDVEDDTVAPLSVADDGTVTIDLVSITDFHGQIDQAPYLQTMINEIRANNPDTHFVASGDLIGGSAFISSVANDEPTIDVLNEMGLEYSAVGNHEFDKGFADLTDRVIPAANWEYLGLNVEPSDPLAPYAIEEIQGVRVAYIGSVTDEVPSLVSPDGIQGLLFHDPVGMTNFTAAQLSDGDESNGEADIVVALVHEGSSAAAEFSSNVDVALTGHIHGEVETTNDNGVVILEAGSKGSHFAHVTFTVAADGTVSTEGSIVPVDSENVTPDPEVQAIVDDAIAQAEVLGAEVIGSTDGLYRGVDADGEENRGTESSLGNILGDAALYTAHNRIAGGADFGIINAGGVREDLEPGEITYQDAYNVQPFGNTIGVSTLTGDEVYDLFNQQAQPADSSRPFLHLGVSTNVDITFNPDREPGTQVTQILINGTPVDRGAEYRVAANTFLLAGGDNFTVFAGKDYIESGYVDLDGFVDYIKFMEDGVINAQPGQRTIGLAFDSPLVAGEEATIELSSLTYTNVENKPTTVNLLLNDEVIGTAPIDHAISSGNDLTGTASVTIQLPEDTPTGQAKITIETTFDDGTVDSTRDFFASVESDWWPINILSITDFHGAIDMAPYMQTMFNEITRAGGDSTVFVSSGDLIGGSAYASSIAQDQPTIDIMNAMGLSYAAVGNHEFDAGYADLRDRVIPAAQWEYLGANVDGAEEINTPPYVTTMVNGVTVAFIGTVTEETPDIVSADGIEGLTFNDPVAKTNELAAQLKADGEADLVVALIHEGSLIAQNISDDVDLILSGHAHGLVDEVTSNGVQLLEAGAKGEYFAKATFVTNGEEIRLQDARNVPVNTEIAPDPEIQALVDEALVQAEELGSEEIGFTDGVFRGINADGSENRGTESSLGNILANAALFTANNFDMGADFGIINPGGVRADLPTDPDDIITYGEAYTVQPFGNTIGTIDLTGAQVYQMLNQQWQPDGSRPMLRLGLSDNISYTFDPTLPVGEQVTGVWLNGELIDPEATYTVASNTFLLSGQDGFTVFTEGTNVRETGYIDLNGFVDYIKAQEGQRLTVPAGQRSIGVVIPEGEFVPGEELTFELSSLVYTNAEVKPTTVQLRVNGEVIGEAAIDATISDNLDSTGTASVSVIFPEGLSGDFDLEIVTLFEDGTVDGSFMLPLHISDDGVIDPVPGDDETPGDGDKPAPGDEKPAPGDKKPGGDLAKTGADVTSLAAVSLALLALGALALRRSRVS